MKHHYYPFEASFDYLSFDFVSCSESKRIRKRVEFVPIGTDFYNLAFGDVNSYNEIDDRVISNNKDMEMVLATIIQIVQAFLSVQSTKILYFKGSSPSRTRLYQMVLMKEQVNWKNEFEVYGVIRDGIKFFEEGINFESFLIKRKNYGGQE